MLSLSAIRTSYDPRTAFRTPRTHNARRLQHSYPRARALGQADRRWSTCVAFIGSASATPAADPGAFAAGVGATLRNPLAAFRGGHVTAFLIHAAQRLVLGARGLLAPLRVPRASAHGSCWGAALASRRSATSGLATACTAGVFELEDSCSNVSIAPLRATCSPPAIGGAAPKNINRAEAAVCIRGPGRAVSVAVRDDGKVSPRAR
jgi:hypothetical protein